MLLGLHAQEVEGFPTQPLLSVLTQAPLEAQSITQRLSLEGGKGWGMGNQGPEESKTPQAFRRIDGNWLLNTYMNEWTHSHRMPRS